MPEGPRTRTERSAGDRRRPPRSLIVAALVLVALGLGPSAATAAAPSGCVLHVVAHQDDDLLFQSPALLREVRSGGCVRTVFLTAGDAGGERDYWSARERGAQSAYAEMAGVADEWTSGERTFAGRTVVERTLRGRPDVSLLFLRLPDGLFAGAGSERYGFRSLRRLWQSTGSSASPSATAVPVDGSTARYDRQGLIDVLKAVMDDVQPRLIAAQDWTEPFGDGEQSDHADHVAAALFAREAAREYATPHVVRAYQDYSSAGSPVNLSGLLLRAKQSAFYAYARHDYLCRDDATCDADPDYGAWLKREYVMDTRTVGVVADAGYAQEAVAGATVRLDGSASATATGAPRSFRWTQTAGPTVTLRRADTAAPSFDVPALPLDPAEREPLTFALEVSDGRTTSAPHTVTVRPPRPVGDAGPDQDVPSQADVVLDAGGSRDPDPGGAPLVYEWTQLTGSPVQLERPTTATPSFRAPAGPASLRFSLVVRSGERRSFPVPVTVLVAPPNEATTNLAEEATASASSEAPGQEAEHAIDGSVDGLEAPDYDVRSEWSSAGEGAGAHLTLTWDHDVDLAHVELFDRPNGDDRITSGTLRFSDGSEVPFGALPLSGRSPLSDFFALRDDARRGLTVAFAPRPTRSLTVTVDSVAAGTMNVGLAEVRAWGDPGLPPGGPGPDDPTPTDPDPVDPPPTDPPPTDTTPTETTPTGTTPTETTPTDTTPTGTTPTETTPTETTPTETTPTVATPTDTTPIDLTPSTEHPGLPTASDPSIGTGPPTSSGPAPAPTPGPTPPPSRGSAPAAGAMPRAPTLRLSTRRAVLDRGGRFALRLACSRGTTACRARVTAAVGRSRVGDRAFTVAAGRTTTVRMRATTAMRRSVARGSRVMVRVRLTGSRGTKVPGPVSVRLRR